MPASMAGATTTGARLAQAMAVTGLLAIPIASSASTLAVAGATTTASAASASSMCAICCSASRSRTSLTTGRCVRLAKVRGVTKAAAERVSATSTVAPRSMRRRTRSTAL